MKSALFAWVVVSAAAMPAHAQAIPTEPVSLADGRVVYGAPVTATFATADPGFFCLTERTSRAVLVRAGGAVDLGLVVP